MINHEDDEHDKTLREEIIESQKTQAEFLKWKLIVISAVASLSFGLDPSTEVKGAKLLLCLVPLICAYVDLTSLHIMIRIITIGIYLKSSGNSYETFMFVVREKTGASPFVFEAVALHGSSIAFNLLIFGLGFTLPQGEEPGQWPEKYLIAYIASGVLGIFTTISFWQWYKSRVKEIILLAERTLSVPTQVGPRI